MKLKFIALYFLSCALAFAPHTLAQTTTDTWTAVQQLPTGEKVQVERKGGAKVTGLLSAVSATELLLERKGRTESFQRAEIQRLWQMLPPGRKKQRLFTGIGVGVGLFAGLAAAVALGVKQCGGSCNDEKAGIAALVIGLPVGGALAGRRLAGNGKRVLIYSAP